MLLPDRRTGTVESCARTIENLPLKTRLKEAVFSQRLLHHIHSRISQFSLKFEPNLTCLWFVYKSIYLPQILAYMVYKKALVVVPNLVPTFEYYTDYEFYFNS